MLTWVFQRQNGKAAAAQAGQTQVARESQRHRRGEPALARRWQSNVRKDHVCRDRCSPDGCPLAAGEAAADRAEASPAEGSPNPLTIAVPKPKPPADPKAAAGSGQPAAATGAPSESVARFAEHVWLKPCVMQKAVLFSMSVEGHTHFSSFAGVQFI